MKFQYVSRVYMIAVFSAMASLLQLLEIFIILPVPFVKIGLANTIVLFFLSRKQYLTAFMINLIRVFIGGFFSGKLFSLPFLFSVSGALLSYTAMAVLILIFRKKISLVAVSICGAIGFNIAQYFLFVYFFGSGVRYNTTISLIIGLSVIPGLITGIIARSLDNLDIELEKIK